MINQQNNIESSPVTPFSHLAVAFIFSTVFEPLIVGLSSDYT